jgi:hypothetical protein
MQWDLPHKLCQHQTFQATVNKEFFKKIMGLLTLIMKTAGSSILQFLYHENNDQMPFVSVRNRVELFQENKNSFKQSFFSGL